MNWYDVLLIAGIVCAAGSSFFMALDNWWANHPERRPRR